MNSFLGVNAKIQTMSYNVLGAPSYLLDTHLL